jgi:hypothetical protein
MTHDQLARVFPDGRTVHVPSDGVPLKGYELARADIERRGNGDDAATIGKPSLFARLFGGKSNDDEDEGSAAPAPRETAAPPTQVAAARSAEPVPMPRAKPVASTLQLASADAQSAQTAKTRQTTALDQPDPKPQTLADIINERGFWGDMAAPQQATPAQIAAINARRALASADPQSTASVPPAGTPATYQALAYAPAPAPAADRANVVTASAPLPPSARPVSANRNSMAVTEVTTVVAKGTQGQSGQVATSTRIAASKADDAWMRIMILAPSASTSMSTTVFGDTDLTLMSAHFVKPQAVVAMGFSDDPQMGMSCDQFTGSSGAPLTTQSFVMRTASLR